MRKILCILLSVFMSFTIVACTIVQYHHHDAQGNIYITLSMLGHVELDHHGHFCACHHIHDDGCHNSDKSEDAGCSMHLDETPPAITDNGKVLAPQVFSLISDMIIAVNALHTADCGTSEFTYGRYVPIILKNVDKPAISRRGPPALYLFA